MPQVRLFASLAIIAATIVGQTVQDGMYGPLMAVALKDNMVAASVSGAIVAAPWVSMTLAAPLVAMPLSRFGAARCMVVNAILAAGTMLLYIFVQRPTQWLALGTLLGITMAVRWVSGEAWLLQTTEPDVRGRIIGIQETLVGLAGAVGPLILVLTGTSGAAPFLACSALLASASIFAIAAGLAARSAVIQEPLAPNAHGSMTEVAMIAAAVGGATGNAAHSFLPVVIASDQVLGQSPLLVASLFGIGETIVQIPFGMYVDKKGLSGLFHIISFGAALVSLCFVFTQNSFLYLPIIFVLGALCGLFYTIATLEVARSNAAEHIAASIAKLAVANTLGSASGAIAMGFFIDLTGGRSALGLGLCLACLFAVAVEYIVRGLRAKRKSE